MVGDSIGRSRGRSEPMSRARADGHRRFGTLAAAALVALGGCDLLSGDPSSGTDSREEGTGTAPQVVASNLTVPWEIRFLPDGDLLITERPGRLVRLEPGGEGRRSLSVPGVEARGESGLMGLALHPDFPGTSQIYLCYTTRSGGSLENRVVRYRYEDHAIEQGEVVLGGMPAASIHDGCRLEFGPDGMLYVTMGDAGDSGRAQDRASPSGKIHRIAPDGSVPPDNPYGTTVFSYGHRNPQGLAWDDRGRLWSTEHGPSGFRSGHDELNLVRAGNNYGWPEIVGDDEQAGMRRPVIHSGGSVTWAPAGLAHHDGRLYWAGLRGSALYSVRLPPDGSVPEPGALEASVHLEDEYGRLRAVRMGSDGMLYVSTSNRDGRGDPAGSDDRILRLDPGRL